MPALSRYNFFASQYFAAGRCPLKTIESHLSRFLDSDGVYRFSGSKEYAISDAAYAKFLGKAFDNRGVSHQGKAIADHLGGLGVKGDGLAVEIGCGSGRFSLPLAASGFFRQVLITDASEELIAETRKRLEAIDGCGGSALKFGVMRGEDIDSFPGNSVQAYFMAAVLHHFLDWKKMLLSLKRTLKPGGIIYCTDPCLDFSLTMSLLLLSFRQIAAAEGIALSEEGSKRIRGFVNMTRKRGNPFAEGKEKVEDKHIFRMSDIFQFAQENDMRAYMYPNSALPRLVPYGEIPERKVDFRPFIKSILSGSQHMPPADADVIFDTMAEQLDFLEYFWDAGRAPVCQFTSILQKH